MTAVGLGIFVNGFSSIFTGVNFIVTIHRMRAPGMTWFRLPLFIWAHYATSLIMVLGTPVLAITIALLALERAFGLGIFDPALGGDPVLFQHLFWFYSHPAVYIMILPSLGVISDIIAAFTRKPIFGYKFVAFASIAIAVLGFLVWGHHMFVSSQAPYAATVFSILTMLVAVPSALFIFVGFNLTFLPQFILGYLGMPRRYHVYPEEFQVLNVMSTAGASILAVGYVIPTVYFIWSLKWGEVAGRNPWGAVGLEWETTSPPLHNFDQMPVVDFEPYQYVEPVLPDRQNLKPRVAGSGT